jgi:N-acetylglucosamine malate deacetylase 1
LPKNTTEEAIAIRTAEAQKACKILGARFLFTDQVEGNTTVDRHFSTSFTNLITRLRPDILFTQWPIDAHPDHRALSLLCYEAWNRLGKTFALYYYEVSDGEDTMMFSPTDYVDITGVAEQKRNACYAHASQKPDHFYALQSAVTRFRGSESGHIEAEGFIKHLQSPRRSLSDYLV